MMMLPKKISLLCGNKKILSSVFRSISSCKIVEVGPRDGLQNEAKMVSTQAKVTLINQLVKAGCKSIEVGAFVSPKWVPQMADSPQVLSLLPRKEHEGVKYSCLVPNIEGMLQAVENANCNEVAIFASASESFSRKNINCSIEESMDRFLPVVKLCKERKIPVRGYVSCIVACPYEGTIGVSNVARVAETLVDLGCYEISLGDTIGVGTPNRVKDVLSAVKVSIPAKMLAVHFHDTYGQALANIALALDHGVVIIDSSVAGLGGCPYAKGASGNVATEDVLYMLHGMGIKTGIDLEKIVDAGTFICGVLGREPVSKVANAIRAKRVD